MTHAEQLQIIHYSENQEYRAHYDAWDLDTEHGKRCTQRGGQRLLTCLGYLNKVQAGGGTGFPKLDLEVRPKVGRMIVLHNCREASNSIHRLTLHSGLSVQECEKWAFNLWVMERPLRLTAGVMYKTEGFKRVIEKSRLKHCSVY
ncbi:MAG: 2OG-Fe(II) oxygenase [Pseudomonadales bacterium]|nr:2OG-Fe(II) oxygenase [Pseudomonadales bacterium]